jgi:amino-acid N-acetyltransferase
VAALPIDRARASDAEAVLGLLRQNHLPIDGLTEHLATTFVARQDERVTACASLEVYPDGALLRSVAVSPDLQGRGLGQATTAAALRLAEELNLPAVYLLTTTAEGFFPKFGFERIERQAVPQSVQTSVEFTSACPSSATVMRKIF